MQASFCGIYKGCDVSHSKAALSKAKENIERWFPLIGSYNNVLGFLNAANKMFPDFFRMNLTDNIQIPDFTTREYDKSSNHSSHSKASFENFTHEYCFKLFFSFRDHGAKDFRAREESLGIPIGTRLQTPRVHRQQV